MRVVVVVGHQEFSPGASNKSFDVSEFDFNSKLALNIVDNFKEHNMSDEILVAYRKTNYQDLPIQLNALKPDLIVSLHCNAFNEQVSGCEVLYYHKSTKGKDIAAIFQDKLVNLIENNNRGIKPKSSEDRGGYLLKCTNAPCIIVEPFFIDNNDELIRAEELMIDGDLTTAYCAAINDAVKYLR